MTEYQSPAQPMQAAEGGLARWAACKAVSGNQSATIGGKVNPNLELGVRYRF